MYHCTTVPGTTYFFVIACCFRHCGCKRTYVHKGGKKFLNPIFILPHLKKNQTLTVFWKYSCRFFNSTQKISFQTYDSFYHQKIIFYSWIISSIPPNLLFVHVCFVEVLLEKKNFILDSWNWKCLFQNKDFTWTYYTHFSMLRIMFVS